MPVRPFFCLCITLGVLVMMSFFVPPASLSYATANGAYRHYLSLVQGGGGSSTPLPTPTNSPTPDSVPSATPTATATTIVPPSATATPTPPTPTNWLTYLNARRAIGGLLPVTENSDWSFGNELHGRYMVKNNVIGHSEDPENEWYTEQGDAAARASNVIVSSSTQFSYENAIDGWLTGPFHAVGLLDPQLLQSGYGEYSEADGGWQFGAGLDVLRGVGVLPSSVTFPIRFPKANGTTDIRFYGGGESPDPLSACPGYAVPTGAPIYLMVGAGNISPDVTASTFTHNGVPVEHCIYDENTYTNPDGNQQDLARSILNSRDAIVLIPRAALIIGDTYTVTITVNSSVETWSFTVTPRPDASPAETLMR